MYKVVIVDDEPIISEGLKRAVPWSSYGCTVAGTAASGIEGMKLINQLRPEILFTDIRMTNMDGLCMIASLKSEHRNMEITILTGYRDFDYAKEAIRLGVRRYLLKPSRMAEIREAVEAMTAELKRREEGMKEKERTGSPGDGTPAGNFIVKNAVNFMENHYREHLTLQMVADSVFVSPWHLSKLLNGQGSGFSDILNGIRIRKAKELMTDPSLRISDIAEEAGFTDMAHFSRIFRKMTGKSPNEYRNEMR